jgi:hypothetical protein
VPRAESDALVAALKQHQAPVTYLLYRDEGHDYELPANYRSLFAIAERFFHEHLGGRYQPFGRDVPSAGLEVPEGAERIPGLADALGKG